MSAADSYKSTVPPAGATAWAVQLPDGSLGLMGWQDISKFDFWQRFAVLREGCTYIFSKEDRWLQPTREQFEDDIFQFRFIKSIDAVGDGPFSLVSIDCPTQEEFCKRADAPTMKSYFDPFVAGAWWAVEKYVIGESK